MIDEKCKKDICRDINYAIEHYALMYQCATVELEGDNLKRGLAHFICLCSYLAPYFWSIKFKGSSLIDLFSAIGGIDGPAVLDEKHGPDYPMRLAEECLKKGNPKEFGEAIEMCLPLGDKDFEVVWTFALQQAAKSEGKLAEILKLAQESSILKELPEIFAYINERHIAELLEMYGNGERCQKCGWEMAFCANITKTVGGDEHDDYYFQCENCDRYWVKHYCEKAMGDEVDVFYSELTPESAKQEIEKIKKCPNPKDKHCKCAVHLE